MFGGDLALQIFLLVNVFVLGVIITVAIMSARAHYKPEEPRIVKKNLPMLPHDVRQRIIDEAEDDYEKVLRKSAQAFEKDLESTTSHLSEQLSKIGNNIMDDEMRRYKQGLAELRGETEQAVGLASQEITKHQAELRDKLAQRQAEIEAKLTEGQAELEAKFAARSTELEQTFKQKQLEYASKQAELEAKLVQHQAELSAALKDREVKLAQHQAELDAELVTLQTQHAQKQAALEAKLEQDIAAQRERAAKQIETKIGDTIAAFLTETLGHNVDLGAQTPYLIATLEEHKQDLMSEVRE